jgi:hypothetical protein
MPLNFDNYRFTDGTTPLSAATFNPRFQDLDTRIAALEALNIAWEAAVQTLTDFGLARLDSVLSPTFDTLNQDVAIADASVAAITASQSASLAAVAAWQASTLASITAWENALQATALAVLNTTAMVAGNGAGGFAPVTIGPGLSYANGTLSAPTLTWSAQSASFAAAFQNGYYVTAAGITVSLPAGTANGQQVLFINGLSAGSKFTIVPSSGQTVMGNSSGLAVDIAYGGFALIYFAATADWRVF